MAPTNPITTEYRGQVTIKPGLVATLFGSNVNEVQDNISKLMPGIEFRKEGRCLLGFHKTYGTNPVGWVNEVDIPENLGTRRLTEQQLNETV